MGIYVVSTGFAPATREKCILSVRSQVRVDVKHIVIDAAEQHPRKGAMENLVDAVKDLPDDAIVAHLDLDDWLARQDALLIVERMHAVGAWNTYGSLRFSDGRTAPWFRAYERNENVRTAPWMATHLRTWKAGLFKRIKPEHLKMNGAWLEHARDLAEALPILELSGFDRSAYCPETLVIYNYGSSTEHSADLETLALEKKCVAYIRALPPYERLEKL